jgi:hypothetical protein
MSLAESIATFSSPLPCVSGHAITINSPFGVATAYPKVGKEIFHT